jgi:microcystin-dependent protein
MARQWSSPGVIPNYNNQCRPTIIGTVVSIDTGGVWIDGFFGDNSASKSLSVSGGDGVVVARADPTARQVLFSFNLGAGNITQSLTGIYEVPIARITSGAMVDIRAFANSGTPAGVMMDFGGTTAPGGWLLCDGTSYLRTDFPTLFAAISTNWGALDGTHFNVPDLRGRVPVGAGGGAGLTNRVIGAKGGEENHILSLAEVAAHVHPDPGHTHSPVNPGNGTGFAVNNSPSTIGLVAGGGSPATYSAFAITTVGAGLQAAGSGGGHNNMQPYAVATKIIKT